MAEMGDFGGEGGDMGLAAALGLEPLPAAVAVKQEPDDGAAAVGASAGASSGRAVPATVGGKAAPKATCAVCQEREIYPRNKFCLAHKRAYEQLRAKAKKDGKEAEFANITTSEVQLRHMILDSCRANPPEERWARKAQVNWTQYLVKVGTVEATTQRDKEKPFERNQLHLYLTQKMGYTAAEADEEWNKLVASEQDRDWGGKED